MFDRWVQDVAKLVEHEPADIAHAARLVRNPRPRLLSPDAIHLATCMRVGATMVTFDEDLATICRSIDGDCVIPPI